MQRRVHVYVAVVVTASIIMLGLSYVSEPEIDSVYLRAGLTFAALGCLLHYFDFALSRGAFGTSAMLPFLTAMFLAPHWTTVLAISAAALVKEVWARRDWVKGVFNVANTALASALAIEVFQALGGTGFVGSQSFNVLPYVALYLVCHLANAIAVSIAVALSQEKPIWETWKANSLIMAPYDLLGLPFVYVFASVYLAWGLIGALGLALPLLGVRQLYKTNWQLEKINQELLELMVAAIEARDPYTSGHSRRVSKNARIIARAIGLSGRDVERVGIAALLHDVGKIHEMFAPLLRKPDRLTREERSLMETHPIKSAELVDKVSSLRDIVPAVRHHHENWDGSGYPAGLTGEEIPVFARVIMIADTVDAMTTDRPYRSALGEADVRAELQRLAGKQFDPGMSQALLRSPVLSTLFTRHQGQGTPPRELKTSLFSSTKKAG